MHYFISVSNISPSLVYHSGLICFIPPLILLYYTSPPLPQVMIPLARLWARYRVVPQLSSPRISPAGAPLSSFATPRPWTKIIHTLCYYSRYAPCSMPRVLITRSRAVASNSLRPRWAAPFMSELTNECMVTIQDPELTSAMLKLLSQVSTTSIT